MIIFSYECTMSPKDAFQMLFFSPYETIENEKKLKHNEISKSSVSKCQLIFVGKRRSLGLSYTDLTKWQRHKKPTNTV